MAVFSPGVISRLLSPPSVSSHFATILPPQQLLALDELSFLSTSSPPGAAIHDEESNQGSHGGMMSDCVAILSFSNCNESASDLIDLYGLLVSLCDLTIEPARCIFLFDSEESSAYLSAAGLDRPIAATFTDSAGLSASSARLPAVTNADISSRDTVSAPSQSEPSSSQ